MPEVCHRCLHDAGVLGRATSLAALDAARGEHEVSLGLGKAPASEGDAKAWKTLKSYRRPCRQGGTGQDTRGPCLLSHSTETVDQAASGTVRLPRHRWLTLNVATPASASSGPRTTRRWCARRRHWQPDPSAISSSWP